MTKNIENNEIPLLWKAQNHRLPSRQETDCRTKECTKCVPVWAHTWVHTRVSVCVGGRKMCHYDKIKAKLRSLSSIHTPVIRGALISKERHTWDTPKYGPKCWRQAKGLENNLKTEIYRQQTFQEKETCQQDWFEYSAWRFILPYRHKRRMSPPPPPQTVKKRG